MKFEGIGGREDAEALRGELYVAADEARTLDDDEFWEHDLVGATVTLPDGTGVGVVSALEPGPGQDRLVVDTSRGERLIPLVGEIVVSVDIDARTVVIDPPEGLLD